MNIQEHQTQRGFELVADFYSAKASAEPSQSANNAKEVFNAATEQERLRMLTHREGNIQDKLEKMGFEIELAPPWDRSTRVHRNGKPA